MNFSSWSIRNPVPPILLFALLTACGLWAFNRLDVQNFPDMDLPTIEISASLDGAAAAQLETEVARKIEDELTGLTQLDSVTTTITDGSVTISVAFKVGKDTQVALDEVKSAVDQAQDDLPEDMNAPTVSKLSLNASPLITYVVRSDKLDDAELSWFIDNDMSRALMAVEGVGEVGRLGGVDREVRVELNANLLDGLGLTANDVNGQLEAVQSDLSGGKGRIGGESQSVRTLAAADSADQLRGTPIPLPKGSWVRLDELGTVTDSHSDITSLAYLNGKPVIAAQIKRSKGYSDIAVTENVRDAMKVFAAANPLVTIEEAYNTIVPTEQNYESSMHMVYEGALIAIFVVWLFLRDWRATLLAAVALPLSIIPTFLVMYLLDYTLNTITLLALSLVVGILVDDAIVEIENIERHLNMGKSPFDAAMEAADEIGLAVIATTFTLVAVFLPTAFMGGIPGIIFKQFGITASVAVLASLLVARLITPMMAAYIMKASGTKHEGDGRLMRSFLWLVKGALRRRWIPVLGTAGFLALTVLLLTNLSTGFFPASDEGQTQVSITTPPGSTIESTDEAARKASEIIAGVDHVTSVFQATGTASTGGMNSTSNASIDSATIVVNLTPIDDRDIKQSQIEADLRKALERLPGVRVEIGSGGNGTELALTLAGDDSELLEQAAASLEADLRTLPGIGNVTSSAAMQSPEVTIKPDLAEAASLGVTSQAIAEAIRVATAGAYDAALSQLNLPERQVPIRVMLDTTSRQSLDAISLIPVEGKEGNVSLGAVADISLGSSPSEIDRLDRSRNVSLTVELNGRNLSDVMAQAAQLPSYQNLPQGVKFVEQGELKRQSELFSSFGTAMAIGIFCIYAVLVLLFHDFLQPVTILMALPLALGGAMLPLVLSGTSFSMPAVIGLLLLMGIVSKNSILLVEYTIEARRAGMSRFDALVDACHKRARPIVMTTIAMAGGMLPAALSLVSGDSSFRQPMGVVVIGGLITSTFLSLLVIPVVFTLLDDVLRSFNVRFSKSKVA
ncbi:efflux RND transporter permease subunit [Agrobacterium tumefaciens]|uniref:efflux RND transporter permease subunit n=1 Tax=Agrobacterium TaxID=357 RepID=UPI0012969DDD|nr:efflux RND transporter permease subunit [Agrobacterium sp. ICMP 6402]MQB12290.1 AcrB/AcrD/AcrF family protein [Agrobacterium sp. ICMP 6402]NTA61792.1 efflux RND transporter permease subunit [Agrobacterium tumefaciens]